MGILFKHIDDIKIVQTLFPFPNKVVYNENEVYDDGEQAGKSIVINETYELIPVHGTVKVKTIAGEREQKTILWDAIAYSIVHGVRYYPDGSGEPDDIEEKDLCNNLSFDEAITAIHSDIIRCDLSNVMEQYYYENDNIESELNPEPMYT